MAPQCQHSDPLAQIPSPTPGPPIPSLLHHALANRSLLAQGIQTLDRHTGPGSNADDNVVDLGGAGIQVPNTPQGLSMFWILNLELACRQTHVQILLLLQVF